MIVHYNIKPTVINLVFVQGDTINLVFTVQKYDAVTDTWSDWDLQSELARVDIWFRRMDGLVVKKLTSAGSPAEITLTVDELAVLADGFTDCNLLNYDVQVTIGTEVYTIISGKAWIKKQYTE
jgi:hypothetical protein